MNGTVKHLKRYGWLYGLAALVVVAVPLLVWRAQHIPPPDAPTLLAYARHLENRLFEEYGEPLPDRYREIYSMFGRDRPYLWDAVHGGMGTARLDAWVEENADLLAELSDLDTQGLVNLRIDHRWVEDEYFAGSASPLDGPWRSVGERALVHRILASKAMERGEWDLALRELKRSANSGAPFRMNSTSGLLTATMTRSTSHQGYLDLLAHDPPPEVIERAITSLEELAATTPRMNSMLVLVEERLHPAMKIIAYARGSGQSLDGEVDIDWVYRVGFLAAAYHSALEGREKLEVPALRRYATRSARSLTGDPWFESAGEFARAFPIRWTTLPGKTRFVQRVAREEGLYFESGLFPPELLKEGDRWTLAVYLRTDPWRWWNEEELRLRSRVMHTEEALLRSAFEKRLHHARTGEWTDLIVAKDEFLDIVESDAPLAYGPYLPLQERAIEGELSTLQLVHLLSQKTHALRPQTTHFVIHQVDGGLTFEAAFPITAGADELLALPAQFEPFADEVEAIIVPPRLVSEYLFGIPNLYLPGEEELDLWGRLVGEGSPAPAPLTPSIATNMNLATADPWAGGSEFRQFVDRTRLLITGQLDPPGDVRVLWSPGPDGVDDRAMIPYDPTNGTLSRGDIIIFPEAFR